MLLTRYCALSQMYVVVVLVVVVAMAMATNKTDMDNMEDPAHSTNAVAREDGGTVGIAGALQGGMTEVIHC